MYPHQNVQVTFILVLVTALLGGMLSSWLVTGTSHQSSMNTQAQGELKLMLSSQRRRGLSQVD